MTKTTIFLSLSALALFFPQAALASEFLGQVCGFLLQLRDYMQNFVYIMGAISLAIFAISAYTGRFAWSHLFAIGGALFMVSSSLPIMMFLTGGNVSWDSCAP